ncbi:hypothetical protein [Burkholderia alba]|uniref:hypothetical protein n=1 Tax=Burkholderia alba TaxID=2683677 RepID=UPI002B058F28|nr:hypothetical protein [Burkholderia alba]
MSGIRPFHRFWAATFVIAAASEVLSGGIRYYLSVAGIAPLSYLPKVMMVGCVAVALLQRPRPTSLIVACYIAAQTCVALGNGVGLAATGFWIWTVSPLLFAMLTPPEALEALESPRMLKAFIVIAALCNAGVIINTFTRMPWAGGSVDVNGVSVEIAVNTYVGTATRLAGFGRSSATTGLMIGMLAVWLLPRLRAPLVIAALLTVSAIGIWDTTNKTTLIALAIVVGFHYLLRPPALKRACAWITMLIVVLPFAGWVASLSTNAGMTDSTLLASMQDRFINTWPQLLEGLLHEHLIWFGIGPGGFGSATAYYVGDFGFNVGWSDNAALHMIATFGVIGTAMSLFAFAHYVLASRAADVRAWLMLSFLLLSGITTDIYETLGCLLFFGITLRILTLGPAQADANRAVCPVPAAPRIAPLWR